MASGTMRALLLCALLFACQILARADVDPDRVPAYCDHFNDDWWKKDDDDLSETELENRKLWNENCDCFDPSLGGDGWMKCCDKDDEQYGMSLESLFFFPVVSLVILIVTKIVPLVLVKVLRILAGFFGKKDRIKWPSGNAYIFNDDPFSMRPRVFKTIDVGDTLTDEEYQKLDPADKDNIRLLNEVRCRWEKLPKKTRVLTWFGYRDLRPGDAEYRSFTVEVKSSKNPFYSTLGCCVRELCGLASCCTCLFKSHREEAVWKLVRYDEKTQKALEGRTYQGEPLHKNENHELILTASGKAHRDFCRKRMENMRQNKSEKGGSGFFAARENVNVGVGVIEVVEKEEGSTRSNKQRFYLQDCSTWLFEHDHNGFTASLQNLHLEQEEHLQKYQEIGDALFLCNTLLEEREFMESIKGMKVFGGDELDNEEDYYDDVKAIYIRTSEMVGEKKHPWLENLTPKARDMKMRKNKSPAELTNLKDAVAYYAAEFKDLKARGDTSEELLLDTALNKIKAFRNGLFNKRLEVLKWAIENRVDWSDRKKKTEIDFLAQRFNEEGAVKKAEESGSFSISENLALRSLARTLAAEHGENHTHAETLSEDHAFRHLQDLRDEEFRRMNQKGRLQKIWRLGFCSIEPDRQDVDLQRTHHRLEPFVGSWKFDATDQSALYYFFNFFSIFEVLTGVLGALLLIDDYRKNDQTKGGTNYAKRR
jgi:hypothetical protein